VLVSNFGRIFDNVPTAENISWTDFVTRYTKHIEIVSKTEAPAISPAEWPLGSRRERKSVVRVHFAALDLDKISDAVLEHVQKALESNRYFIHTTYSHASTHESSGLNCLRIFLPLSRPVDAKEWPTFWKNLNASLGNVLDPSCKDAGRVYFIPSMPPGTSCANYAKVYDGSHLDVGQLLQQPFNITSSCEFATHTSLVAFAKKLKSMPEPSRKEMGALLLQVANGEVFAEPGARDTALFKICAQLAKKWPKANPEQVASLFTASLHKMQMAAADAPTIEDVIEKLSRKQSEEPPVPTAEINRADILDAFGGKRDTPYSEEELDRFAEEAGIPRSRLNTRWIIRKGDLCYLFLDGKYGTPVTINELVDAARIDLAPAVTSGVMLHRINGKGQIVPKNERELLAEYGTVARLMVEDLSAEKTRYDYTEKTLVSAPCPIRQLEPTYSEHVHRYLTLLGNQSKEQLLDWVALVTKLEKPCAALFLYGAPGTGKSLLAQGLSRLWTTGAMTYLKDILTKYNDTLSQSPLVVADEQIPHSAQKEGGSAELRSLIQEYSRQQKRRYRDNAPLLGALRLMIATNNKSVLGWQESLNGDDIQAIRDRFLCINVGRESAQYLREIGEEAREQFVKHDAIAKHALWLRDNRKVETNTRFLVKGNDDAFSESLVTSSLMGSAVLHWLSCYLQNPFKLDSQTDGLIRIHEGQILVTARALVENWETYITNTDKRLADIHKISATLSNISEPKKKQLSDSNKHRHNYWRVENKYLLHWNQETGFASEEAISNALAQHSETVVSR
jgi:hypothetical protein